MKVAVAVGWAVWVCAMLVPAASVSAICVCASNRGSRVEVGISVEVEDGVLVGVWVDVGVAVGV